MNVNKLRELIDEYINLDSQDDGGEIYYAEKIGKILALNLNETVDFIINTCSIEELYWLGLPLILLEEKIKSKEIIIAIYKRLSMITESNYHQETFKSEILRKHIDYNEFRKSILDDISCMEANISEEDWNYVHNLFNDSKKF